jgi:hypothetical protein
MRNSCQAFALFLGASQPHTRVQGRALLRPPLGNGTEEDGPPVQSPPLPHPPLLSLLTLLKFCQEDTTGVCVWRVALPVAISRRGPPRGGAAKWSCHHRRRLLAMLIPREWNTLGRGARWWQPASRRSMAVRRRRAPGRGSTRRPRQTQSTRSIGSPRSAAVFPPNLLLHLVPKLLRLPRQTHNIIAREGESREDVRVICGCAVGNTGSRVSSATSTPHRHLCQPKPASKSRRGNPCWLGGRFSQRSSGIFGEETSTTRLSNCRLASDLAFRFPLKKKLKRKSKFAPVDSPATRLQQVLRKDGDGHE